MFHNLVKNMLTLNMPNFYLHKEPQDSIWARMNRRFCYGMLKMNFISFFYLSKKKIHCCIQNNYGFFFYLKENEGLATITHQ